MPPVQSGPSPVLIVILLAALILIVWLFYCRRRGRRQTGSAGSRSGLPSPTGAMASAADARSASSWAPPAYAAPTRPSGPSLVIGISTVRVEGDQLLIGWNAVNDGSVPLKVQWGAPVPATDEGGALRLLYAQQATAVSEPAEFEPPPTRLTQPGEILSRTTSLSQAAIGRELAGLKVSIAVGYGPADSYPDLPVTQDVYLGWQRVATSHPRTIK